MLVAALKASPKIKVQNAYGLYEVHGLLNDGVETWTKVPLVTLSQLCAQRHRSFVPKCAPEFGH